MGPRSNRVRLLLVRRPDSAVGSGEFREIAEEAKPKGDRRFGVGWVEEWLGFCHDTVVSSQDSTDGGRFCIS